FREKTMSSPDLPVIDLSILPSNFTPQDVPKNLLATFRETCESVGFFRLINHGIPQTLIEKAESTARNFFAMPTEMKERALYPTFYRGFIRSQIHPYNGEPTPESVLFPNVLRSEIIPEITSKIWPEGNPEFLYCQTLETIESYARKALELSNRIIKLCIISLGVDSADYLNFPFDECEGWLGLNNYSPKGKQMAYRAHTDITCVTVLHQDNVGGLEVLKDGQWCPVAPQKDSLVINIGDILQMWSNYRCRSSEHRVIYGQEKSRISIGFFYVFRRDMELRAPKELIDIDHPQKYRPIIFGEFERYERDYGPSLGPPGDFLMQHI
ncbi:hypothetical protein KI387_009318, partial [Taxus chinensis]